MQTTYLGRRAESTAAHYLESLGYQVLELNWRRRECEIDIVARNNTAIHLVEVKYRGSDGAGSGLEYITSQKLRQMTYAANRWVAENRWHGEYVLSAVEVSGEAYDITAFIDNIGGF